MDQSLHYFLTISMYPQDGSSFTTAELHFMWILYWSLENDGESLVCSAFMRTQTHLACKSMEPSSGHRAAAHASPTMEASTGHRAAADASPTMEASSGHGAAAHASPTMFFSCCSFS